MNVRPTVALGDVLKQDTQYVHALEPRPYPKLSVKLYGRGVVMDTPADGGTVKMQKHQFARSGQVILSEIWAKKGAIGIVPPEGDGALCTSHFFLFDIDETRVSPGFIAWLLRGNYFEPQLNAEARGTTGYAAIRPKQFLATSIPLPPLEEQRRIVHRLDMLAEKTQEVQKHLDAVERDAELLLALRFRDTTSNAPLRSICEVAPVVRRPVEIHIAEHYREIGARSFGKGLFTKPDFDGATATWEKPVWVKSGDLVLSNIKAWEGAIAVASDMHDGCIASHRYITCVPDPTRATANFISYYLLSEDGLEKVGFASPGTADRNRTLSLGNLGKIEVPVPALPIQQSFDRLQAQISALKAEHATIRAANAALLPATLERMFS